MMRSHVRATLATTTMMIMLLAFTSTAFADNPAIWSYYVETFGEDVFWDSLTAVDNTGDEYDITYEITRLDAYAKPPLFPAVWVDVTGYLDPNTTSSSATYPGPPPITIFDDTFVYPPPPDNPGFQAQITMTIDAAGFGHLTVTNIIFGTIVVPDFPLPVEIQGMRIWGEVTVEAFWTGACCYADGSCAVVRATDCAIEGGVYQGDEVDCDPSPCLPPLCPGDSNCDGFINFRDIDYFVAAQNDNLAAWEALFDPNMPSCDFLNNDANGDGFVNFRDIDPFVALQNTTCP